VQCSGYALCRALDLVVPDDSLIVAYRRCWCSDLRFAAGSGDTAPAAQLVCKADDQRVVFDHVESGKVDVLPQLEHVRLRRIVADAQYAHASVSERRRLPRQRASEEPNHGVRLGRSGYLPEQRALTS